MVNTGKPSPGCFACRTRRIKCDTTRPECRKCRKRGWKCPGYRDLNALRIVDETQKQFTRFSGDKEKDEESPAIGPSKGVIIRQYAPPVEKQQQHQQQQRSSPKRAAVVLSSYPSPISPVSRATSSRAGSSRGSTPIDPNSPGAMSVMSAMSYKTQCSDDIPRCIGPPIADQVYGYFLQNFVQGMSLRNHGYLDFLFPLLAKNPTGRREDNPLPLAFSAAAMMAFAARQKVPELLPKAESIYMKALQLISAAISNTKAADDSILACLTLLTTFEQLRPTRPSIPQGEVEAFGSHLDNGVALLKLRGKTLFQTIAGRKIFVILRLLLVSRSLCFAIPLDPEMYNLTAALDQDYPTRRFAELSLRAADMRVAVERLLGGWGPTHPDATPPTTESVRHLLRQTQALEADYMAHLDALPLAWKAMTLRYMTAADAPIMGGIAYEGRIDAYVDLFLCYILNWARAAMLYSRNTILRCTAWLLGPDRDYRDTPEYTDAIERTQTLITDIVASVPYGFGVMRMGQEQPQKDSSYRPPSLTGVFCIWPVFAAASSDFATDAQRVFLRKTLKYVAEEIGIAQASVLAGYNMRSPSMPIAFTRMKQFEAQGKQLHGVAVGTAAATVMNGGLKEVMKTTGAIISSPRDHYPKAYPIRTIKRENDDDDDYPQFQFLSP